MLLCIQENFTTLLNATLADFTISPGQDDFKAIYANKAWNWCMVILFMLGLGACIGLLLICWFEESGKAGPYRTWVNQLVTKSHYQIIMIYLSCGITTFRAILGPQPIFWCRLNTIIQCFTTCTICLFVLAIDCTKYYLIFVYKSVPVMNDNFLVFVISINVYTWSLVATCAKFYIELKPVMPEVIKIKPLISYLFYLPAFIRAFAWELGQILLRIQNGFPWERALLY